MRRIDELHLDDPFAGRRMLRDLLRGEGVGIGRDRVVSLMRRRRIAAIYRRPNTSKSSPGHKLYPYLLRGVAVGKANQGWGRRGQGPAGEALEKSDEGRGNTPHSTGRAVVSPAAGV